MWFCDGAAHREAGPERWQRVLGVQPLAGLHQHPIPGPSRRLAIGGQGRESSPLAAGGVERRDSHPAGLALLLRVGGGVAEVGAVAGVAAHDQLLGGFDG